MISSRLYKLMAMPFAIGVYLRGNARHYDHKRGLYVYESWLQPWITRHSCAIILYWIIRLGLTLKIGIQGDINGFNISMAFFSCALIIGILYGIAAFYEEEASIQVNAAIIFLRHLQRTYMTRFNPDTYWLNILLDGYIFLCLVFVLFLYIIICTLLVLFPRGPMSISSIIPIEYFYLPVAIVLTLLHFYVGAVVFANLAAVGVTIFVYLVYFTLFFTRELRLGRRIYLSDSSLREEKNFRIVFRACQMLHQNEMYIYGIFLLICNGMFMLASVYVNFVLIRYWNDLDIYATVVLCFCCLLINGMWAGLLEFGRLFHARGSKVLGSWRKAHLSEGANERAIMKRFVRSCRPILLSHGKQFVVGRVNVLVFFRGVTRGTVRALLTTR